MPLSFFLILSALLFSIGVYGVLARQNAVLILFSIELMLNAANINLVAFSAFYQDTVGMVGQVFALFVIAVAAAEVGIGLAIVILIFRNRQTADVDELSLMKW
jgi:NADH:ubiquinone oxidoreductase subunit K